MKTYFLTYCLFLFSLTVTAQSRQVAITIDDIPNSKLLAVDNFNPVLLDYLEENHASPAALPAEGWERISLPHTWNRWDVMDAEPGYRRAASPC